MARRSRNGYATFEMANGATEALMTVCPGNPDQEGSRFKWAMEAAGTKLDRLFIIEAGDLGYHNLRRLVSKHDARDFARYRGQRWQEIHQPIIDQYMQGRCEVIPMRAIVAEPTYEDRIALIHAAYERGNNAVTSWFDGSINADIERRTLRKEKDGIIIEPWAIKESALDYLCDEYAMRSIMWQNFKLEELYLGRAVNEHDLFQRENISRPDIDLTIPKVCPIILKTVVMIHDERKGRAFPSNDAEPIPAYARHLMDGDKRIKN